MSDLFVLKKRSNGRFTQTGYSDTDDIQKALVYSRKGRYGWLLDADEASLGKVFGDGVEVIPVRIEVV